MELASKKELKQMYKEMKTPMGIFMIKNLKTGRFLLHATADIKSMINRDRFQLKAGSHRFRQLQQDWNEYGEDAFVFEVLEQLEYDEKDENKDYSEELEILKMIWLERLGEDHSLVLYEK